MKFKFLFVILLFIGFLGSNAQSRENILYEKAYHFLNDSIVKIKFDKPQTFAENCNECCVKGTKLKFESELQVANKFIENYHGFPFSDLIKKKYSLSEECIQAIRIGSEQCKLANQVQDSLKIFWSSYKMQHEMEISKALKNLISTKKDGYQVFFSDIYQNTLAAELMSFCTPFDKTVWMGNSTSFFFIFNDEGNIEQVYSGITINYN
jgi:hypothetical protein